MQTIREMFIAAWIGLLSTSSFAANWPQYRGPNASGIEASQAAPTQWNTDAGQNIAWQTPIPGLAHAAPIVWGDRVFVATAVKPGTDELKVGLYGDIEPVNERDPVEWRLLAINRDSGAVVWNQLAHAGIPRVKRHPKATHCNSTPATDGQHIVALFGSEGLWCFDLTGRVRWKKDLGPMDSGYFKSPSAQWGFASSPVLSAGKVIVQCDVQTNSFLAVFEATDGRVVWRTTRKDVPTWSTPAIITTSGRTQIAINGWRHSGGYDFRTGAELWRLNGGGDIPVPTPVFAHDLIFLTSAHGPWRPIRTIRPTADGDITPSDPGQTNAAIVWAHGRQGAYMQTPIVVGDWIWSCTDSGVLTCFDARTGVVQYSERLVSGGGQGFTASPVSDGRHLFFASEVGNVFVLPAKPEFTAPVVNTLGETCLATPALSDGTLYFRTRSKLLAIRAKP